MWNQYTPLTFYLLLKGNQMEANMQIDPKR